MVEDTLFEVVVRSVPQWYFATCGPRSYALRVGERESTFFSQRPLTPALTQLYDWMAGRLGTWKATLPVVLTPTTIGKISEEIALQWLSMHAKDVEWDRVLAYCEELRLQTHENEGVSRNLVLCPKKVGTVDISDATFAKPFARLGGAGDLQAAHFSDTFVLSAPPEQGAVTILLSYVRSLCAVLLKGGLYPRGAIVRGELYHRRDVIFGPALVEAYLIEKNVAKHPRLVVTSRAQAIIESDQDTVVSRDSDGQCFLDFLCALERPDELPHIRERVGEKIAREAGRSELKGKNDWMLAYIDRLLSGG